MYTNADINEEYELTPDILFARISQLEEELARGKLTKESMEELLEFYTVASEFYQENNMMKEFTVVVKKMKDFFKHDKIQHLVKKSYPQTYQSQYIVPKGRPHASSVKTNPYKEKVSSKKDIPIVKEVKDKHSDHNKETKDNQKQDNKDNKETRQTKVVSSLNLTNINVQYITQQPQVKKSNKENIMKKLNETKKEVIFEKANNMLSDFKKTSSDNITSTKADEINQQQLSFRERLEKKKKIQKSTNTMLFVNKDIEIEKDKMIKKQDSTESSDKDMKIGEILFKRRGSTSGSLNYDIKNGLVKRNSMLLEKSRSKSKPKLTEVSHDQESSPTHISIPFVDINLSSKEKVQTVPKHKSSFKTKSKFSNSLVTQNVQSPKESNKELISIKNASSAYNNTNNYISNSGGKEGKNSSSSKVPVIENSIISKVEEIYNNAQIENKKKSNSMVVKAAKSVSNKNLFSSGLFYDKTRNAIRISQKKLIEIQANLLTPEKEEDLIEIFFRNHNIGRIIDNEFNLFLNKLMQAKKDWINNCKNDLEKLVNEYSQLKNDKIKDIKDRYNEELSEIEKSINLDNPNPNDVNLKIYNDVKQDMNNELALAENLNKEKVEELFTLHSNTFSEEGFLENIDVHRNNILQHIKDKFLKSCEVGTRKNSLDTFE